MPIGQVLLVFFVVSIVMFCNSPCVQYLQVTVLLKATSKRDTNFGIFLIALIVGIPTVVLVFFGYVPQIVDEIAPEVKEMFRIKGETPFSRMDTGLNSQLCTFFLLTVMIVSIIFAITCYFRIKILMKEKFQSSSSSSKASRKTQESLNMMSMIQFIFPFFTIHTPFFITFILPFFNFHLNFLSDNMLYLSALCPAANPIIVMCVVKNVRDIMLLKVLKLTNLEQQAGNKSSQEMVLQKRQVSS